MSTKIEDLSDTESMCSEDELDIFEDVPKKTRKVVKNLDLESELESLKIVKFIIEKVKEPVLVSIIMYILTKPMLISGIMKIPYMDVLDENTLRVTSILSILAGLIFMILRTFV